MGWAKKSGEDFSEVQKELSRSKVGRTARLKGRVETIRQQTLLSPLPVATEGDWRDNVPPLPPFGASDLE
jgi:hypothetical protein